MSLGGAVDTVADDQPQVAGFRSRGKPHSSRPFPKLTRTWSPWRHCRVQQVSIGSRKYPMAYVSTQRVRQVLSGLRKYSRGCATRKSLFINHFQKINYQTNSLKFQLNIQRKNIKFDRISKLIACSYEPISTFQF